MRRPLSSWRSWAPSSRPPRPSPAVPSAGATPDARGSPSGPPPSPQTPQVRVEPDVPATARRTTGARPEVSRLAMRDLFLALPRLGTRPTDGRRATCSPDRPTAPPTRWATARRSRRRRRAGAVCIHWVDSTADAPPSRAWVAVHPASPELPCGAARSATSATASRATTGAGGGNRLDVCLKGWDRAGSTASAPRALVAGAPVARLGLLRLDATSPGAVRHLPPRQSLRVTAARVLPRRAVRPTTTADPWLLGDRDLDGGARRRRRQRQSAVPSPSAGSGLRVARWTSSTKGFQPVRQLDLLQYLSSRFGTGVVKSIWTRAGAFRRPPNTPTTVKGVLALTAGSPRLPRFAGRSTPDDALVRGGAAAGRPRRSPPDLAARRRPPVPRTRITVDHLASRNVLVRPDSGLRDRRWRLKVAIDGPAPP